jgi:small subunit ribosomal protein S24e
MQVLERKENPLLDRVEIEFKIGHDGKKTPSRDSIISAVAQAEPGAKKELIIVKNINTRFGRPQTTGTAYIYGSTESMTVEPVHALKRHGFISDDEGDDASGKAEPAVAAKTESSDDAGDVDVEDVDDVDGGEE